MAFSVEFLGHGDIKYIEDGIELHIYTDFRDDVIEMQLSHIREEISIKEKQRILKNIYDTFILQGWEKSKKIDFDFSPESNSSLYYKNIINILENGFSLFIDEEKFINNPNNSDLAKKKANSICEHLFSTVVDAIKIFNNTDDKNREKFKVAMTNDIYKFLIMFSEKQLQKNLNQKNFNYGLYALNMIFDNNNKEEIKKILEKYKQVAEKNNLTFKEFMLQKKPFNKLLKEVLNG